MTTELLPLYAQIQHYIKERIGCGDWLPHSQIPAERTLAEQFGVSRITSKNAILGLVAEGLLYRMQGKGTFVSEEPAAGDADGNPNAASLSAAEREEAERIKAEFTQRANSSGPRRSKRLIGLIMPWMEFQYASRLVSGIEAELSRRGFHLLFKRIGEPQREESTAVRDWIGIPVDGLIMVATRGAYFHDDMIRLILDKFPLVFVEKYVSDYRANRVYCDTEKAGRLMGEYLADCGYLNIGLISYPTDYTEGVKERIFGLQASLVERGIPPITGERYLTLPAHLIEEAEGGQPDAVPDEIVEFVRRNEGLDAIAAADAQLTGYAGRALRLLNRAKTALIGFDEPGYVQGGVLPDAYIDQSPAEMGAMAARLIVEAIEGQSQITQNVIEPKLVRLDSIHSRVQQPLR